MLNKLRPRSVAIAFFAASTLLLGGRASLADNLTNLLDSAPSLLSQGTPDDVFNTLEFDYGPNGRELTDDINERNGPTGGWTMNATITPAAGDVLLGETRLIMEIGGTSNGTGLWLIDGIPTLALKTGGDSSFASSLVANDLDITDNAAAIYSSFGALSAGTEYTVAATWDADNRFTMAVQDNSAQQGVLQSAIVTGTSNTYNWLGNGTFLEGNLAGNEGSYGGLSGMAGNPFTAVDAANFEGTFNGPDTLFWNEPATLSVANMNDVLTLHVDLDSGDVKLLNPTSSPVEINGYELIGGRSGFFNSDQWNKLANNDADPWTTDDPEGVQKSIGETTATGGFTLAANGGEYSFGSIWAISPFVDVSARVDLAGGGSVNALVEYAGSPALLGDYDNSGAVDAGDWPFVLAGLISNVSALDGIGEYLAGDLTGNGLVNRADFRLFKELFEMSNGAGSFDSLVAGVPEPDTLIMLMVGFALIGLAVSRRRQFAFAAPLLVAIACCAVSSTADAADIYFVSDAGEIKLFSGIADGATPVDGNSFGTGGTSVATVSSYGGYQGFTSLPDGRVFGVNQQGGVDSWPSINDWTNGANMMSLSTGVYGPEITTSPRSGIHGASFDANTGGFFVVYEGPDANEGDLGQYATLNDFINNTNANIFTPRGYPGNIANFYYPDEDTPAGSIPPNPDAQPGSNYFSITGNGQLEGWLDMFSPGFGFYGPAGTPGGNGGGANRSYQLPNFGNNVVGAFAVVEPIDELTLVVDTTTGVVSLKRASTSRTIDFLQVSSPGNGLLPGDGYLGLGANAEFPQGDGTATSMGWDLAPSNPTSDGTKAEFFAFGTSEIAPGASLIPLGLFYNAAEDLQDLVVTFDEVSGETVETINVGGVYVEYVTTAGLPGDYNGDNSVDAADYVMWRRNLGTSGAALANRSAALSGAPVGDVDYLVWRGNFGASLTLGSGASAAGQAVPEPSCLAMLALAAMVAFPRRR